MQNGVFDKFRKRIEGESWLKSALCSASVGFAVTFFAAFAFWFTGFKHVWLCAVIWAVISAALLPAFYFLLFKPTDKVIARRLDKLGLNERIITMKEFENDNSFMARKQREDAEKQLSGIGVKSLKYCIGLPIILAIVLAFAFSAPMTVVSALSASDVISSGKDIIEENKQKEVVFYDVDFKVELMIPFGPFYITTPDEGGFIDGDIFQKVAEGSSPAAVRADPEPEYMFKGWRATYVGIDGATYEIKTEKIKGAKDPYFVPPKATRSITYIAIFTVPTEGNDGDDGARPGDQPGDSPGDMGPQKPGATSGMSEDEYSGPPDLGAGGGRLPNENIIDDNTYYGSEYEVAYKDALEELGADENMTDGEKDAVGDYFDGIKTENKDEEENAQGESSQG